MDEEKTILVVDDEPNLVQLIEKQLEDHGYNVLTANNGVEGLKILDKISPDLIILDMNMPEMGGIVFYKSIADERAVTRWPVLVLTTRTNLEPTFQDLDAAGFLAKPFNVGDLLGEVERILSEKGG